MLTRTMKQVRKVYSTDTGNPRIRLEPMTTICGGGWFSSSDIHGSTGAETLVMGRKHTLSTRVFFQGLQSYFGAFRDKNWELKQSLF
jgi:hypothetical protein